ncbi:MULTISPECIES: metallophosphoesterase family protein [Paenibacillus]|nr:MULTISPECIES: metallophosphoesterase [Paenibacillus]
MSRRAFIGWMLAMLALIATALAGLVKLLQKVVATQEASRAPGAAKGSVDAPQTGKPEPQAGGDPNAPLFSLMVLSDLHVSEADPHTIRNLKKALEDIQELGGPVDAIALTGDLTEYGSEKEYKGLSKLLSAYKLPPLYANMGNHDYYDVWIDRFGRFNKDTMPNGKTDWQSRERFQAFFGLSKPYHDVWVQGHHVILLSQETYVQEKPEVGEGAWYSEEQLAWLEERLAAHKDGKPVFIMTHQPLPPAGRDGKTHQLIPANRFREILKPYKNVFVFCGHSHQDFQGTIEHYVRESFHYFHNSSVGRVMNRKYETVDKEKSQGLYVQVYRDRVTLRGRDFTGKQWLKEADWTVPLTKA